jgi:hypothetical protein
MADAALMGSDLLYKNIPHSTSNCELKDYIVTPQGMYFN